MCESYQFHRNIGLKVEDAVIQTLDQVLLSLEQKRWQQ